MIGIFVSVLAMVTLACASQTRATSSDLVI
jgi:hypothetical protein